VEGVEGVAGEAAGIVVSISEQRFIVNGDHRVEVMM
jgi:hypothetical protein